MGWYLLAFLFISFAFSSVPQAPVYPDLYTVSFTMNPGSLVLEAYDFTAKQQVFWFSGKNEVKVLNRFDLGQSFTTALNATCTKAPISEMQPPNFLSSFTYSGNQTCTSPNYLRSLNCYVWKKDQVTVYTDSTNGNPITLLRPGVTIYYEPIRTVLSFNPAVFRVPAVCETEK